MKIANWTMEQTKSILPMKPLRLVLADPIDVTAEGVRSWLTDEADLTLAGHARTGHDLLRLLLVAPADLVLLEVSLPGMDGIDTMREIHARYPSQRVLAYSALPDIEYVNSMLIEGATGYLLKSASREEFLLGVRTVLKGGRYLSEPAK